MYYNGTMRLFIGVQLDSETHCKLLNLQNELKAFNVGGNYTEQQNFHLTLKFLGECSLEQCEKIKSTFYAIDILHKFDVKAGGVKSFKEGKILYCEVELSKILKKTYSILCQYLKEFVIIDETENFIPHITLRRGAKTEVVLPKLNEFSFEVNAITLFESRQVDGRLQYLPLCKKELG